MNRLSGSLLIAVLVLASLIAVEPALAATVPKPSVPEFTLSLVSHPYDVPTTYITDPFTGESMVQQQGYHVENKTIELTIKNQKYTYTNGSNFHIYYNVQAKGHFEPDWNELYPAVYGYISLDAYKKGDKSYYIINSPAQSGSQTTVLSFSADQPPYHSSTSYPPHAQVDFQVEAIIGYDSVMYRSDHALYPEYGGWTEPAVAYATTSGWSNTRTITIDETASTTTPDIGPSQNSTESTDKPESQNAVSSSLDWVQIAILSLLAVITVLLFVDIYLRKRKHKIKLA